jgi:hypothetical protein
VWVGGTGAYGVLMGVRGRVGAAVEEGGARHCRARVSRHGQHTPGEGEGRHPRQST